MPNAQRAAIITSTELATYDSAKHFLLINFSSSLKDNTSTHFLASGMSGFVAAVAATPIDVVKTRIMNQQKLKNNSNSNKIYKGSIDCFIKVNINSSD